VPLNSPVAVLKPAHVGFPAMLNVRVPELAEAVGVNE
jgi:hypothetical protein